MIRWLLVGALLIIGLDLALLVVACAFTGVLPILAILLVTAFIGFHLAKREGFRVFYAYQEALHEGRLPDEGILSALLVLAGGVSLMVPGFLSDLVGIALLFGPTRRLIAARIRRTIESKLSGAFQVTSMEGFAGARQEPSDSEAQAEVFDARREQAWAGEAQAEVIDTEGVEVQSSLLLGEGDRREP
jgi:UPF0716 protein FxsA